MSCMKCPKYVAIFSHLISVYYMGIEILIFAYSLIANFFDVTFIHEGKVISQFQM